MNATNAPDAEESEFDHDLWFRAIWSVISTFLVQLSVFGWDKTRLGVI
jgi:hypothetical protein